MTRMIIWIRDYNEIRNIFIIPNQKSNKESRRMCMRHIYEGHRFTLLKGLAVLALCYLLAGCNLNINVPGGSGGTGGQCQSNCTTGSGIQGVSVIVEPDAGPTPLVNAIQGARKSVDLEVYLLTNHAILRALEEDANRGVQVRVMLEPHPFGGGATSPSKTLDELKAAGVQAQDSNPAFALTHEKGMTML